MLALVQRVAEARVMVGGRVVGQIAQGLLVLVCAEPADTEALADPLRDQARLPTGQAGALIWSGCARV